MAEEVARQRVGVVGAGMMGREIAFVFALAGHDVLLTDADRAVLDAAMAHNRDLLASGRFGAADLANLTPVTDLSGFGDRTLVIEAVFEDAEIKGEVLGDVDRTCPADCIIASNTSSIPITTLAQSLGAVRRSRFLGMHFSSPVSRMEFLELIRGPETADAAMDFAAAVGRDVGKAPTRSADVPGFASNRLLFALLTEAIRLVEEGVATPEDIDATCRLALGHPVGPFRLMDRISNTLVRDVQRILTDAYGARYETGAALDELIARGHTGRKAGRGWHRYGGVTS